MKKTVMNLAIVSCFALGASAAQAYNPNAFGDPAASAAYTKNATVEGQTQNIKVGPDGVRLPYNMAEDRHSHKVANTPNGVSVQCMNCGTSLSLADGARQTYGGISPYFPKPNVKNPPVEAPEYWNMTGKSETGEENKNQSAYSRGYFAR
ncbi:conserved exported hypothetical protein [Candidatus Nitrotoga sp. BS]|uniref:hypothetical protein n=1 Tax=Candidatus Nitrotoga sp. BS TaxID=2890408 RepID=UPI001EF36A84|nr:hypothetical protein [Candidatus Nitrotoga sp. BS]CAH1194450.1 conserved exported hypothetical protein [Candidatus Nitrotoga sp. BS]